MHITGFTSILIADELPLVREGIVHVCKRDASFNIVAQCADGVAALGTIQNNRPDIAFVDLQIPKLFSLEVIRKSREADLPTRFIVLASRGDRKTAVEAIQAGASGFLLKSCPPAQLLDALQQVRAGIMYVTPELQFEKVFLNATLLRNADPLDTLSSREYAVFRLLVDGNRPKDIAQRLELSPKTIDTYRASLMRKLEIRDVAGLVKFAMQRDLVMP